jgi:hypothetical protein
MQITYEYLTLIVEPVDTIGKHSWFYAQDERSFRILGLISRQKADGKRLLSSVNIVTAMRENVNALELITSRWVGGIIDQSYCTVVRQ